jgi:glycosyltransferase involved in cell wall biosynthesis
MKILCVIDSLGSGGAQRQIVGLAKGFKQKGNDVSFLVYHQENFYLDELVQMNIPCNIIKSSGYLDRIIKVREFIRSGNFEGIISFLEGANFMVTLAGFPIRRWKLILGERNANPNILSSFKLRFYRWFHFFCDYIVSNSKTNLDMINQINPFLNKRKMKVICNFVDNNVYASQEFEKSKKQNDKLKILVASSHQNHKNAKGLIESLNNLDEIIKSKIFISWYGAISPDNSYYKNQALINEYNLEKVIEFLPETPYIKEKMLQSDVVGLFSFYEGLPNVICEAMMLGKPVITSAVSDLPDILKNTQNLLFNPNDNNQIEEMLSRLVSMNKEDLTKIANSNKELAMKLFDKTIVLEKYLKLLKENT